MASDSAQLGTGRTGGRDASTGVIPGRYALSVGMPDTPAPDGWEWTALSSVAQLESGHTPARKHPEYWDGPVPWIGIRDATGNHGRTIHDTIQHVTDEGLANSSARLLPANTVCLSRTASVGYVVVMGRPMATSQDFLNWVCGPEIDHLFLKYVLLAEKEALLRFASGTTHQTIYYPEAKAFHVCLPPLPEQKRIAHVLGTLDDKIELNRRMNATLDGISRAIFKSWFVDFDPVRQKAAGHQPVGMDAQTAALFPDSFEDSEIGEVPTGWSVGPLSSIATIVMGLSPKGDSYNDLAVGVPLINGPVEFGDYFPVKTKWTTAATRLASPDDLILCVRGSTTGRRVISDGEYAIGRGVCAITPTHGFHTFLYETVSHALARLLAKTTGSVFPSLSAPDIKGLAVLIPSTAILERHRVTVDQLTRRVQASHMESSRLAALRDTLLPKLLSGEIRVPEAEEAIEEATR